MISFPVQRTNNRLANPIEEVENWQREMDQLFNLTFPGVMNGGGSVAHGQWIPALDIVDEGNQLRLLMDLPGMTKKDINVSVEEKQLTIQGERHRDKRYDTADRLRCERRHGTFQRRIALPAVVDTKRVKAVFRDGVLEIYLPKIEDHRPKQIEIQIE